MGEKIMGTNEASRNMTREQLQRVDATMYHWNQANPNAMHGEWERAWIATAQKMGFVK